MASLGFWNLIVIAFVALVVNQFWKIEREAKSTLLESKFLQHPLIKKIVLLCQQPQLQFVLKVTIILVVSRWLIYVGYIVYRLIQPGAPFWDFNHFYRGAFLAFNGENLYQSQVFKAPGVADGFIYPPNIIPLIYFLGSLPIHEASRIWVIFHLLAIVCLLWGANILLESNSKAVGLICTIICGLIYGIVFDLRVGNISSIVSALLLWTIILAKKQKDIPAGILLGLSTIKPTLSLLFFIYLLLKRRWKIVITGIGISVILAFIGIAIIDSSLIEVIRLYKESYNWHFQYHSSNNPFLSHNRVDLAVIVPRLLPFDKNIAKILSSLLSLSVFFLLAYFFYLRIRQEKWSNEIKITEISLIACFSLLVLYSQRTNTAILVFVVVFMINFLLLQIRHCKFSRSTMSIWLAGMILLLLQTGIVYDWLLESHDAAWRSGNVSYLYKITIGSLPNYTLLALFIIILILSRKYMSDDASR